LLQRKEDAVANGEATPANGENGEAPAANDAKDAGLPDPSSTAKGCAFILLLIALGAAVWFGTSGPRRAAFVPGAGSEVTPSFAWFAGFLVASQIIERALEVVAPFLPLWALPASMPRPTVPAAVTASTTQGSETVAMTPEQMIAQKKADRGFAMLGLGAVLGVIASAVGGLYLLHAIGMKVSFSVDIAAIGLAISGGTKTLHELVKALESAKSGATAG
jgi:hypothetical protein